MCAGIAADWTDISGKEGVRIPDKSVFMLTRHDCDVFQFGAAFQGISQHAAAIGINKVTSWGQGIAEIRRIFGFRAEFTDRSAAEEGRCIALVEVKKIIFNNKITVDIYIFHGYLAVP